MRQFVLILVCFAFAKTSFSQVYSPNSEAAGLATVAYAEAWGAAENPANGNVQNGFAARLYGFTPFEVVEVSRYGLDLGYKAKAGFLNLGLQYFGAPGYSITGVHFGAGRQLSEGLNAGLRVGIVAANYEEFGSEISPVAQIGLQYEVSNALSAGAHYTFVSTPQVPLAENRLRVGINYASSPKVNVLLSVSQTVDQRLAGGLGITYQAAESLSFRAGMRTGGLAFSLGADAKIAKGLSLCITAVAYQEIPLGVSYGIDYF